MTRIIVESDVDTIVLKGNPYTRLGVVRGILKDGIDGWYGTPASRENGTAIPQQDGDYWPSRLTADHRVVTVRGLVNNLSSVENAAIADRINDLMTRVLKLTVEDAFGRRHADGWLSVNPGLLMKYDQRGFSFSLVIYCPDPLKYGDPVTFTASNGMLKVENAGRVGSWPRVHVDGRVTGLTLTLGGHRVTWQGDATSLNLDFRDMIPSSGTVTYDDAFQIPPGQSTVVVNASGGTVSMTLSPAWR